MIGTHAGFFVEHWQTMLAASAAGIGLALAYLATEYLVLPAWRLRAARRRGPYAVGGLIARERRRLRRLEDDAAVREEHDHPDAKAWREETELRRLVVAMLERANGVR